MESRLIPNVIVNIGFSKRVGLDSSQISATNEGP